MTVTGVTLGSGAPAGSTVSADLTQAGRALVRADLGAAISSAAALQLVRIQAEVPLDAGDLYTQKAVLDLTDVSINQGAMAVRADDGVFVNAYVGDATGNRAYSTLDVQRLQRVVVRLDSGFAPYLLLDPAILGDTTGNGIFNSLDVQRLQQRVVGLPQTSIPPLPDPPLPPKTFSGADPVVRIGTAHAVAGGKVQVPVSVDDASGIESIQITVRYPQPWLTLLAARQVGVTSDFEFRAYQAGPGVITIDISRMSPLATGGPADLFMLEFQVASTAPAGSIPLDLQWAALNDTWLTLNPAPVPGPDVTDGSIVVRRAPRAIKPPIGWDPPGLATLGTQLQHLGLALSLTDEAPAPWATPGNTANTANAASKVKTAQAPRFDGERRDWVSAFVGNLGRTQAPNPNAGLRLTLPVAAKPAAALHQLQ